MASTAVAVLALFGCQDNRCSVPHESRTCDCADGGPGLQTCWAGGTWGECLGCPSAVEVRGVSLSSGHGCAWLADGTVKCWGDNQFGQVGRVETGYSQVPEEVGGIADVVSVSLRSETSCAIIADGTARCWGRRLFGLLGDSPDFFCEAIDVNEYSRVPVEVVGLEQAQKLVSGSTFTCALTEPGKVACWGLGMVGELGIGEVSPDPCQSAFLASPIPVDATGIDDAIDIAAGWHQACALRADGTVSCWGDHVFAPTPVPELTGAVALVLSLGYGCGRFADGTARCWGSNDRGQLGDGTTMDHATPQVVPGLGEVVDLAVSGQRTCAVLATGEAWCWGECGSSDDPPCEDQLVPTKVWGLEGVTRIALGHYASACVLMLGGSVACWNSLPRQEEPEPLEL